ncbi:MAG: transport-associated protein [Ramlibacter sp.]|nr:transport-associated protein [Ramlibacter sp.]
MKNNKMSRTAAVLSSLALLLALGACSSQVDEMGPAQSAQAGVETDRQALEGARTETAAIGVENNSTAAMGAGPAIASTAEDPDSRIATAVKHSLATDPDFTALKIDVHSEDGVVTLIGRAPDPAARERAAQIARNVRDVRSVENQLTLG